MNKPAIVVVAYNRKRSLERLLSSLKRASYPKDEDITLIISIDKGDNEDVVECARKTDWDHGELKVICHEKNLGLKAHVLECGDHALEYGSVIILEDDLLVAEDFYNYSLAALNMAKDDDKIGGISLYDHLLNVHTREPFYAIDDGYDNYYMQFASSWGQAYSSKMWQDFRSWLSTFKEGDIAGFDIPDNVSGWSERSWLKYNIKYLVEKDMYFLYPRVSLTTNFMEEGEHSDGGSLELQVPMLFGRKDYSFSSLEESLAVYDAFFENKKLRLRDIEEKFITDLYGNKRVAETGEKSKIRYALSSRELPYKVIRSYGRILRPVDANIVADIKGEDLFLYDLKQKDKAPRVKKAKRQLYNYRAIKLKEMLEIIKFRLKKGR
ncbi:MAG: glycosyltransferase [Lachnospiraceae bacterium]|nr:glycosyltransferase [Lachnospiraceae bacterium]